MKKIYFLILFAFAVPAVKAQYKSNKAPKKSLTTQIINKKSSESEKFLDKQWWMGIKAGTNLSDAIVTTAYSAISPSNYEPSDVHKKYERFSEYGANITLEITFYIKQLSLSIQPTYRHSRFVYTNNYQWTDSENAQNTLNLNYRQQQEMDHLVIPLLIKFDLTTGNFRPYIQAGGFGAFLINANKSVTISGTDFASGGENTFSDDPIIVGSKNLFANNYYGMVGGAGINYHQGNVRLNLDFMYQYGLTNIVSAKNRYSNSQLSGVGDVMDDMTLNNIVITLGCLFPLRFLSKGFKSLDRK